MKYIGIDIGGTKISVAVFDKNGEMLITETLLIEGSEGEEVGRKLVSLCNTLCKKGEISPEEPLSIGVCIPGIAYSQTGCVWAPNIKGWENYPVVDRLKGAFPSATVTVESDRTCYILGEEKMGMAKGCKNAIFIAVGTGIGAGILVDGKILHGASDIIGAVGWMALQPPYSENYDQCGCFESMASGEGIAAQARLLLKESKDYDGILKSYDTITSREVFAAYESGDFIAVKVLNKAVELWGMAAANLVSIFNPEMVIFGGGVFGPAIPFIGRIYDEAAKWAQPISIKNARFVATSLPKMAGLYGAGAVAIRTIEH